MNKVIVNTSAYKHRNRKWQQIYLMIFSKNILE